MLGKKKYVLARNFTQVGAYLREMREKKKLTQREVSLELGYSSAQFISNFENGIAIPPMKKLRTLLKIYEMNPDVLMDLIIKAQREIMATSLKIRK